MVEALPFSETLSIKLPKSSGNGFVSHKCLRPIAYTYRCCRDAQIQATLDRRVWTIAPLSPDVWRDRGSLFAFEVNLEGGPCQIHIDARSPNTDTPSTADMPVLDLKRQHVLSEPLVTSARMVWSHRQHVIPFGFEQEIRRVLRDQPTGMQLKFLQSTIDRPPKEVLDGTLALACRGIVDLETFTQITGETKIFQSRNASQNILRQTTKK